MTRSVSDPTGKFTVLASACGLGLLFAAGAQAAPPADTLGEWREYARRGVMPEYSWADAEPASAPSVLTSLRHRGSRGGNTIGASALTLGVNFAEAPAGYAAGSSVAPSSGLLARDRSLIRSELVASSLGRDFGTAGQLQLTAVVAHQRYASAGFGTAPWLAREDLVGLRGEVPQERSSGHGVRLDYSAPVGDALTWNLMLQSRLDMDAFESYRGVYSEAGDFDLPARVETQLQVNLSPVAAVAFGVERVFYSDISAFTSAALPSRFLSLLGDGSSPEFAWRDLTVYSVEGSVLDATGAEWSLRYTTRQQPSPTSALLERSIESEFTDTNFALGYRRGFGDLGQLWLAASYAPSRYFLGATPYQLRNAGDSGSQVELEAFWAIPF